MRMDCQAAEEHIDARALGTLDTEDARALDAHIAGCATCTARLHQAEETAASIGLAVPLVASSAALKSRIMASAAVLTDIGRGRRGRWWPAAAAALFLLGSGAVAWGAVAQLRFNDLEGQNARIARGATAQAGELATMRTQLVSAADSTRKLQDDVETQDAVLNVALQPDVEHTPLKPTSAAPGATARCIWSRTQAIGAFIAENLPRPAAGTVYQVWVVYENAWTNSGTLAVDEAGRGKLIMNRARTLAFDPGAFLGFAVTVESSPNATQHSSQLVLTSMN